MPKSTLSVAEAAIIIAVIFYGTYLVHTVVYGDKAPPDFIAYFGAILRASAL